MPTDLDSAALAANLERLLDALPPGRYARDRRARRYVETSIAALRTGKTPKQAQAEAARQVYGIA